MFVYLSKFLPQFVYPVGLVFLLLILTLILVRKRAKAAAWLIIIVLLILAIAGNRWVSAALTRSLEWRYIPPKQTPSADVIVLLGGGTESADAPRPMTEINGAGDRILYTAVLYKAGAAPHILLSGGNLEFSHSRGTTPAEDMQQILALTGVPAEALWLQEKSQNTAEDALYSAEILKEKGISKIILVTSAQHMPRSVALFEAQGLEVIPAPTDYTITEQYWSELMRFEPSQILLNLMPSSSSLNQTTQALKEYLGMGVYKLQGWME